MVPPLPQGAHSHSQRCQRFWVHPSLMGLPEDGHEHGGFSHHASYGRLFCLKFTQNRGSKGSNKIQTIPWFFFLFPFRLMFLFPSLQLKDAQGDLGDPALSTTNLNPISDFPNCLEPSGQQPSFMWGLSSISSWNWLAILKNAQQIAALITATRATQLC